MNPFKPLITKLLRSDEKWCKTMGFVNPYIDPFKYHLYGSVPVYDGEAYKMYPQHNFVYDKLWIAKSQKLKCGTLENLFENKNNIKFPVFIKPRWGHLSATSKNCFKIKNAKQLNNYNNFKHMMWSDFIDGREGMTDFIVLNGNILHQITYIYSDEQLGFADTWKYISSKTPAPTKIKNWVQTNLSNFTGVVNVQYRNNTIIEVGLRLARSGAYIVAAQNPAILTNISNVVDKNFWDFSLQQQLDFQPFYAFKCAINIPILYLWPQYVLDILLKNVDKKFYEYYFEPLGGDGMVFLQFMHSDFDEGMRLKKKIELLFTITQFIVLISLVVLISVMFTKKKIKYVIIMFLVLLYLTRFLNPHAVSYNLYKSQKQSVFGGGPNKSPDDLLLYNI